MRHLLAAALILAACDDGGPGAGGENAPPTATLSASTALTPVGAPVEFSATGSDDTDGYVAAYRFIYGDGSPASLTGSDGATHAFAAAGTYTVRLVVVDDDGATGEAAITVTVTGDPPTDPCPEDATLCDGACVDTRFDHMHCGECGHACGDEQACENSACVEVDPPGTLLESFPPPPFTVTRGLTNLGGSWFMTTGRRFVEFDLETGVAIDDWFLDDQQNRRSYGLAGLAAPGLGPLLATGSFNRFGDPTQNVDLDFYPPSSPAVDSIDDQGGPCAYDGTHLYVFSNEHRSITRFDPILGTPTDTIAISGFAPDDWFTDLAFDGHGGAWLTRPSFPGFPPLLAKVNLTTGAFIQYFDAPDLDGLGGLELHDGDLWGIGANGAYRMVP